jgi:hypothetical protein
VTELIDQSDELVEATVIAAVKVQDEAGESFGLVADFVG